ncbi:hypothetical protein H0H92_013244 [Tricholoma furcatifolium]|nr:hypothetical protein H0H92_013244 [Tricholoma furcatifolium]
MARPRKYHTSEEIRLARCWKSKRWYDKNRSSAARSRTQQANTSTGPTVVADNIDSTVALPKSSGTNQHQLLASNLASKQDYWPYRVGRLTVKVNHAFQQRGPKRCIESLYSDFLRDRSTRLLDDTLETIEALETKAGRYANEILSRSGLCPQYSQAAELHMQVLKARKALQEVVLLIMEDNVMGLQEQHAHRALLFQSLE